MPYCLQARQQCWGEWTWRWRAFAARTKADGRQQERTAVYDGEHQSCAEGLDIEQQSRRNNCFETFPEISGYEWCSMYNMLYAFSNYKVESGASHCETLRYNQQSEYMAGRGNKWVYANEVWVSRWTSTTVAHFLFIWLYHWADE